VVGRHGATNAHQDRDAAAFVDVARSSVNVVLPDLVRSAMRPQLAFKAVAAKVKLHDQAREKLRQLDFVANACAGKVDFL